MKQQLVTHNGRIYDGTNPCTSISVHETSNPSNGANAQAHANLQSSGTVRQASWHVQVDDTEAIRSYPDTAQCWHAGTDEGNRTSIAVEICVNADGDYDAAFARAAGVVADLRKEHGLPRSAVVQHNHWTGKNCPTIMRLTGRWEEFLNLTETKEAPRVSTMVSPFEGRLTQNHGDSGGYRGHRGMDIAPPRPGQTGMPVYAAFAGVVKKTHSSAKHGGKTSTWAPGRTGNGVLIANPDGEGNGYNHVRPAVKVGQHVAAGQLIGHNDRSGTQTAPHLHFELWGNWGNAYSDYDPALAFRKFGIKPGSAPGLVVVPAGDVKPHKKPAASKPSTSKPAASSGNSKADNKAIQAALNRMGINVGRVDGVNGGLQKAGVKTFQRAHGLVADGQWGAKTQAVFDQNKRIQQALKSKGYTKQIVDGLLGAQSEANIRHYQKNHGLYVDGQAGSKTRNKLGV